MFWTVRFHTQGLCVLKTRWWGLYWILFYACINISCTVGLTFGSRCASLNNVDCLNTLPRLGERARAIVWGLQSRCSHHLVVKVECGFHRCTWWFVECWTSVRICSLCCRGHLDEVVYGWRNHNCAELVHHLHYHWFVDAELVGHNSVFGTTSQFVQTLISSGIGARTVTSSDLCGRVAKLNNNLSVLNSLVSIGSGVFPPLSLQSRAPLCIAFVQ